MTSHTKTRVSDDMKLFRLALKEQGLEQAFKAQNQKNNWYGPLTLLLDCVMIALAFALVWFVHWLLLPLALLLIGNRQRAIANLLHEAGHGNLMANSRMNNTLTTWCVAPLLWSSLARYRETHRAHHQNLGDHQLDPDLVHDARFGHGGSWLQLFGQECLSWPALQGALFGDLGRIHTAKTAQIIVWWSLLLGAIALLLSPLASLCFLALWILSRATVFHMITVFREIADHAGLQPGALIDFTRNNPSHGVLRHLFHPHQNGYHLIHHLAPRVPYYNLPKVHPVLMQLDFYAEAEHCDGYFFGKNPVVISWLGGTPDASMSTLVQRPQRVSTRS